MTRNITQLIVIYPSKELSDEAIATDPDLTMEEAELLRKYWTNSEVRNSEVRNSEVRNSEVRNSEVRNSEVRNSEVRNSEVRNSEVRNSVTDPDLTNEDLGQRTHIEIDPTEEERYQRAKAATEAWYAEEAEYDQTHKLFCGEIFLDRKHYWDRRLFSNYEKESDENYDNYDYSRFREDEKQYQEYLFDIRAKEEKARIEYIAENIDKKIIDATTNCQEIMYEKLDMVQRRHNEAVKNLKADTIEANKLFVQNCTSAIVDMITSKLAAFERLMSEEAEKRIRKYDEDMLARIRRVRKEISEIRIENLKEETFDGFMNLQEKEEQESFSPSKVTLTGQKRVTYDKVCAICGTKFIAHRVSTMVCSQKCRNIRNARLSIGRRPSGG